MIDSGASDHMTRRRDWFCGFEEFEKPLTVRVGNGDKTPVYGKGSIEIETFVNGQWIPGIINDVLYVPFLKQNLFSVKVAAKKGVDFSLTDHGSRFILTRDKKVIATGSDDGDLYKINLRVLIPRECYECYVMLRVKAIL